MGIFNKVRFYAIVGFLALPAMGAHSQSIGDMAKQLTAPLSGDYKIAVQPVNHVKSGISASAASSLLERLTNSLQKSLSGSSLSLVERAKLAQVMQEQEEFKSEEEFSELLASAGADILVVSSISRIEGGKFEFSARTVGASGKIAGKVLSATEPILINAPIQYAVSVDGVRYKGKIKEAYSDSLVAGLTQVSEIKITEKKDIFNIDYKVSSEIEFLVSVKETEKSLEAKQSQGAMSGIGKAMGGMTGGDNPLGAMFASIGQSNNAEDFKKKKISVTVITKMKRVGDGKIIIAENSGEKLIPFTSEKAEVSQALKGVIRKVLRTSGEEVALRTMGRTPKKGGDGDLLD
jgi:hypothetical protein